MRGLMILIKGAGEMASGIAHRLYSAGLMRIIMTEVEEPLAVRRTVCFCEAVSDGAAQVEGINGRLLDDVDGLQGLWQQKTVAVLVDPEAQCVRKVRPHIVIDARMTKKESATRKTEAPLVIGVGPGFTAPDNVHAVIESNRGHNLGKAIYKGSAEPFTGVPGDIGGHSIERVLRSPHEGRVRHVKHIGDCVKKGEVVLYVGQTPIIAWLNGMVRGLIRETFVKNNEKVGDIDPRCKPEHCYTVSDKARAIGGGVLEAIMADFHR